MKPVRSLDSRGDRGSIILMVIFATVLSLMVLLGAVSAAHLYATQKRLFMAADGAALAASQSFSLANVSVEGGRPVYRLTDADVSAAVKAYLGQLPGGSGLRVVAARTTSPTTAKVTLRVMWRPPLLSYLFPVRVPLTVTSRASGTFY